MAKIVYKCLDCGFKFERNFKPNSCPYCGSKNIVEDRSSEDLVKEVDDILKE